MDDYPAGDPIPDPNVFQIQHKELVDFLDCALGRSPGHREMRQTAKSSFKQAAYAGGTVHPYRSTNDMYRYFKPVAHIFVLLENPALDLFWDHPSIAHSCTISRWSLGGWFPSRSHWWHGGWHLWEYYWFYSIRQLRWRLVGHL